MQNSLIFLINLIEQKSVVGEGSWGTDVYIMSMKNKWTNILDM